MLPQIVPDFYFKQKMKLILYRLKLYITLMRHHKKLSVLCRDIPIVYFCQFRLRSNKKVKPLPVASVHTYMQCSTWCDMFKRSYNIS